MKIKKIFLIIVFSFMIILLNSTVSNANIENLQNTDLRLTKLELWDEDSSNINEYPSKLWLKLEIEGDDPISIITACIKNKYNENIVALLPVKRDDKLYNKYYIIIESNSSDPLFASDYYISDVFINPNKADSYLHYTVDELKSDAIHLKNKVEFKLEKTIFVEPFFDVNGSHWYSEAVRYVYHNNIIAGYDNGNFGPEDKLTRGQLVTIIHRMEGSPKPYGGAYFSDVDDSSKYYYNAVKWASYYQIISGYENGKFGPNDYITREQIAVILNKYAKYKEKNISATNNLSGFKDANKVSDYAIKQMKWAVGAGVITGNANKTLNPKGNATRAEAAAMLEKYCKKVGR